MATSIHTPSSMTDVARATWSAGDYAAIATYIAPVGEHAVRVAGVRAGERVLDVACGTGNATLPAARAGGRVTGVDITPELLAHARRRAAESGVDVELVEGDVDALPFPDAGFDVVLSTFGAMFSPHPEQAARELLRVLRPGGRLVLCNWTPEGETGAFFRLIARHAPPPPGAPAPLRWGEEPFVRELFAPLGADPAFDRETIAFPLGTRKEAVATYTTNFGPLIKVRERLEPEGRWTALVEEMGEMFAHWSPDGPDRITYRGEYLVVQARRPA